MDITTIFRGRTFNKEESSPIVIKPTVVTKPIQRGINKGSEDFTPLNRGFPKFNFDWDEDSKKWSGIPYKVDEEDEEMVEFVKNYHKRLEDGDTVISIEDEIELFRTYKIDNIYVDDNSNEYKIYEIDDNHVKYTMNEYLGKFRNHKLHNYRTQFLHKLQMKPGTITKK